MDYQQFLADKLIVNKASGFDPGKISSILYDFQRDIVRWALRRGKAAIFADCGLGKTLMQLEWARHVCRKTNGNVLILAPLAVSTQTAREGLKLDLTVTHCREATDVRPGLNITNYELLHKFDVKDFQGIVLDESSILKAYDGKTRTAIITGFQTTPYKLACTATPAPNDHMELGNHAEFLGALKRTEMLATFFVHDGGDTAKWRIKGHAKDVFWKWVCSWAVLLRRPSDLGYDDNGFMLPPLNFHEHIIDSKEKADDRLFAVEALTLQERQQARRASIEDRVRQCAELVNNSDEPWLIWCGLNSESAALTKAIKGAVEVKGADSAEHKESSLMGFARGEIRCMVSKPTIAGYGLNLQSCNNMAFVGLSDSYEQFYQAVRRCWRFGQTKEVNVHLIIANTEGQVLKNIQRKEADAETMAASMVGNMHEINESNIKGLAKETMPYVTEKKQGPGWELYLGDCVEKTKEIADNSIHYSVFSPPFASLYTYTSSERDMGNCNGQSEFLAHFRFLVSELYRVTMPGRLLSFHCMNLPTTKTHHGFIGIEDFRGNLIKQFTEAGFIYHSEVCIWKDPVTAMQRTKALGLLHKQIKKDSCMSRQGIPDYLVTMRKPGDNPERVTHTNESFPVDLWQKYASPVWMDINPSKTLQRQSAREHQDERHICPLQLEVIERAIELWTNPGDTVLSPFAGIGSEGFVALKMNRQFVGIELKPSYFNVAASNLTAAIEERDKSTLGI